MRKIELKQQCRASIVVRLNAFGGNWDARSKRDRTSNHVQFVAKVRLLRDASPQTCTAIDFDRDQTALNMSALRAIATDLVRRDELAQKRKIA
jgi:hypothetical protein